MGLELTVINLLMKEAPIYKSNREIIFNKEIKRGYDDN
jgi:hypothetical protein